MSAGEEVRPTAMRMGQPANPLLRALQWALDRMVSVGYGVVYDYIVERFKPYRELHGEVLGLLEGSVPPGANRREVRVLDVGCGPGNFTTVLAEAGFEAVGIDRYDALVELAREKRQARHLATLAFRHGDLAQGNVFREEAFDRLVNIHSLYVHPQPDRLLKEAFRVLKPGGQALFVNFTRRVRLGQTLRQVKEREGLPAALRCLFWVLPNAVFEAMRKRIGPHYWEEDEFRERLGRAGFRVLEVRRTFFNGASLLARAQKEGTSSLEA